MSNPGQPNSRDYRLLVPVLAGAVTVIVGLIVVVVVSGRGQGNTPSATGSPIAAVPSSIVTSQQTPSAPTSSTPLASNDSFQAPPSASPTATERPGLSSTNPIPIGDLPFKYDGNNRRAPSPDASVEGECDATEFGDHAVWFSYSPPADTDFGAWVSRSTGYAELWAFEHDTSSSSLRYIGCSVGPYTRALWFPARAGSTYLIMLTTFAHQGSGGRGGAFTFEALSLDFPRIEATFDPRGVALGYGANLSGTITCSTVSNVDLMVDLHQGDSGFGGNFVDGFRCGKGATPWFYELEQEGPGEFVAGSADAALLIEICLPDDFEDPYFCKDFNFDGTITLRAVEDEPTLTPSPPPPSVEPTVSPAAGVDAVSPHGAGPTIRGQV